MKQKNAFPPNFIHSLDSSHMMLTSLHCERAGITFVSVHDCYWTHPSTVHIMNKVIFLSRHLRHGLVMVSVEFHSCGKLLCVLDMQGTVCGAAF